jgi:thymidylate synthase ThyX
VEVAQAFVDAGYHKQIVNRLLEPFQHIHVVVTATEWANFFALRRHEDAQPEIKALADAIYAAMEASQPNILDEGEWHLPYVTAAEAA